RARISARDASRHRARAQARRAARVRRVQGRRCGGADQASAHDDRSAGAQRGRRARARVVEDRARSALAARRRFSQAVKIQRLLIALLAAGYPLLMASAGPLYFNPTLYAKLPYDIQRDFEPITQVSNVPNILAVHPSVPINSVKELIDYAKANAGKLRFGTPGSGSSQH